MTSTSKQFVLIQNQASRIFRDRREVIDSIAIVKFLPRPAKAGFRDIKCLPTGFEIATALQVCLHRQDCAYSPSHQ
jgi:hypothetical protein